MNRPKRNRPEVPNAQNEGNTLLIAFLAALPALILAIVELLKTTHALGWL